MIIELFENPYRPGIFLTRDGRVFRELSTSNNPGNRYHTVKVPGRTGNRTVRRHVLVLETFKRRAEPGEVCRHLDGNKHNDHPDNLEWGTQLENMQDTVKHGRTTQGVKNRHAKLTEDQVLEIRRRHAEGESQAEIAAAFGVGQPRVSSIVRRREWKHI